MLAWSFSIGRIFGVQVRLHSFFFFLLILCVTWSSAIGRPPFRGIMLWLLLLLAVVVRETARALAAAWFSLDLRSILLLPTGGIQAYNTPTPNTALQAHVEKRMAIVGPITSVAFGLTLAALALTVAPTVNLFEPRWVTPAHLVRTAVWLNLLLAAVNLLPAWPLDAGRVLRTELLQTDETPLPDPGLEAPRAPILARTSFLRMASTSPARRVLTSLSPAIAIFLIVYGLLSVNWWLIMAGLGILLGAHIERQGLLLQTGLDQVLVQDVMLTDFSFLSASATLDDALEHARHSLQDVFPVVRGSSIVGAIARQSILEALEQGPNTYVQGIMTRSLHTSTPTESLPAAIARISSQAANAQPDPNAATARKDDSTAAQLIPILQGDRVVGILTPQNLHRSMSILPRRAQPTPRPS